MRGFTVAKSHEHDTTPEGDTPPAAATCAHCGLARPSGRRDAYCCDGCKAVAALLREHDLERYYELRTAPGGPVGAVPESGRRHDWLAEAVAQGTQRDGSLRLELRIQGLHCAACVWVLEELWRRVPTALDIRINPAQAKASLRWAAGEDPIRAWIDAVEEMGYRIGPLGDAEIRAPASSGLLMRMGLCIALAMNVMLLSLAAYLGLDPGHELGELFRGISAVLASAAMLIGGPTFFKPAWQGLRHGVLHLDVPISVGLLLAWSASMVEAIAFGRESYFDTLTIFVALMLVGRYLQERAVERNRQFVLEHRGTEHFRVRRVTRADDAAGAKLAITPVEAIESGDTLVLTRGDLVPVRARATRNVRISLDWINGESDELLYRAGDQIPAGALVQDDEAQRVEALEGFASSRLVELLRTPTEDTGASGARRRLFSIERVYVALVFAAAILWSLLDPTRIVSVVTSVLVVTCPCALGLATPLAFDLALTCLRRRGIFVRRASFLERAAELRTIFFDKTGTLTWGRLRASLRGQLAPRDRTIAATMAASSKHPRSAAIARLLEGEDYLEDVRVRERAGSGSEAEVDGRKYRLGAERFVAPEAGGNDCAADTSTCVAFGAEGRVFARFPIEEDDRPGIAAELAELRADGYELHVLSGDRRQRVQAAAKRLQLDAANCHGALTPEDKADYVRERDNTDTMMIGDGINDGPALDAATCAGTPAVDRPVLPSRCDFYYTGLGVGSTLMTLRIAKAFRKIVRTNLALAVIYNVSVLALAFAGRMNPLLCAVVMPLSSIVLVSHTIWRLRRFGTKQSS